MEEMSGDTPGDILTPLADVKMDSVDVHPFKHGHPFKRKPTGAEKDEPPPPGPDADGQNEPHGAKPQTADAAIPSQVDVNHNNNGGIFESNDVKGPVIHALPENNISGPPGVANGAPEDGSIPVVVKKKRGRPRKIRPLIDNSVNPVTPVTPVIPVPPVKPVKPVNSVNSCETDVSDADKDSGPARRLRSRREQPAATPDGNTASPAKNTNEAKQRGFKRRGRIPDQHNLAKLPKVSRDVSAAAAVSDGAAGERVEADVGEPNTVKQEAAVNREGQSTSRPGEAPRTTVRQVALGHRRLLPKPPVIGAQPSLSPRASGEPGAAGQSPSLNASLIGAAVAPQTRDPSGSRGTERDGNAPRTVDFPSNVKDEDVELELDHFGSMSQSNNLASSQYHGDPTVKSEGPGWNYDGGDGQIPLPKRRRNVKCNEQGEPKPAKRRRSLYGYRRSKQEKKKRPLLEGEPVPVPIKRDRKSKNKSPKARDDSVDSDNQEEDSQIVERGSTRGREKVLLKCKDCGRTFKFLSQYIIHRRIHTGERPYKCSECGKSFSKNSNLNLHMKTHRNYNRAAPEYPPRVKMHPHVPKADPEEEKPERIRRRDDQDSHMRNQDAHMRQNGKPTCQYCGKQFPFQSALVRHVRVHTGEKPYKCDICGRGFGQAYFLRVHELTHWSVKRYNCTLCGKSFTHYSNAKNHPCRFLKDNQDPHHKKKFKPSLSYTCHICKNTYYQLQDFNSHMKDHTGAKLYRCLFCDKLYGVLSEFNIHRSQCVRARGEGDYGGKEGRRGTFELSLPRNRRNSSGQMTAPVIPSVSGERRRLTGHESSELSHGRHARPSKKPFQPSAVPPQRLTHLVSRLNQLDNRSDPRRYSCPSCGRLFRHMGRLRAHMLTHARGQSYTCGCCGKTLENWQKLWHHQRVHRQRRGRFTCPQCGQGFRFVGPYKRHMTEHPEYHWIQGRPNKISLPYQCEECSGSFKTLDLLFSHQVCHSSLQDMSKDSDFHVSLDAHTALSTGNAITPPANACPTDLRPETRPHAGLGLPLHVDSSSPEVSVPSLPPQAPAVPLAQNRCLEEQSGGTPWCPVGESTPGRNEIEEDALSAQAEASESPGKQVTGGGVGLKDCEEPSEGLKCAVCGTTSPTISHLYQHYLQHARGQL